MGHKESLTVSLLLDMSLGEASEMPEEFIQEIWSWATNFYPDKNLAILKAYSVFVLETPNEENIK